MSENSPANEKRRKLLALFKESDIQYLWLLNNIFNVNFKIIPAHMDINYKMKKKITKKLLTSLTHSCFQNLWVIFIDDAEFADEESLSFLHKIAKYGNVFFILGSGNKLSNNYLIPNSITNNAKVLF
jgi:hypothetical protein